MCVGLSGCVRACQTPINLPACVNQVARAFSLATLTPVSHASYAVCLITCLVYLKVVVVVVVVVMSELQLSSNNISHDSYHQCIKSSVRSNHLIITGLVVNWLCKCLIGDTGATFGGS